MTTYTILVPKNLVLENILGFSNSLASISEEADEFIFDFQTMGYITPFGMLFVSFAIRKFIEMHPQAKVTAVNVLGHWYASHMGYFQACGFDVGKLPGEAKGSDTYLPITILSISELQAEAHREGKEIGDIIEARSRSLACILTQQQDCPLADTLTYTFREMIRNVIEHSKSDFVAYCAQYQPAKRQAEIGIIDTGIGIRASLSQNPYLKIENDHEALNLALMPGISGKVYKGVRRDPYDVWQNSGFGLFAVSRLCGHEGKFLICSGDTVLDLRPAGKTYHASNFQGTAIRLNLSSKDIGSLQTTLAGIMKDGDKQAKEFKGTADQEAATASRMISSEFMKQVKKK